jgi:hypothetical protein
MCLMYTFWLWLVPVQETRALTAMERGGKVSSSAWFNQWQRFYLAFTFSLKHGKLVKQAFGASTPHANNNKQVICSVVNERICEIQLIALRRLNKWWTSVKIFQWKYNLKDHGTTWKHPIADATWTQSSTV